MPTKSPTLLDNIFGTLDKAIAGYKDIKTFDLKQDLLESQLQQQQLFTQLQHDSNINAQTQSPYVVYGAEQGGADNKMVLAALALVAGVVLVKAL